MLYFTHFTFLLSQLSRRLFCCVMWHFKLNLAYMCVWEDVFWNSRSTCLITSFTPWGWLANQIDRKIEKRLWEPELQLSLEMRSMFVNYQYLTKVLTFFIKRNNKYKYFSRKNGCMFDSFTLLYVWILNWQNRQENRLSTIMWQSTFIKQINSFTPPRIKKSC